MLERLRWTTFEVTQTLYLMIFEHFHNAIYNKELSILYTIQVLIMKS